jgi:hypothetical protein
MAPASTTTRRRPRKAAPTPKIHAAEISLAEQPAPSPHLDPIVLDLKTHRATVAAALAEAERLGKVEPEGPPAEITEAPIRVFSLERWQSPFKDQRNRGTCWAFAGAAALEAAYRRKFNTEIDVSEEYVFHMGKSFALNRTAVGGPVVTPVENNSSLTGFQGSGDICQKLSENAAAPEVAAPYIQTQGNLEAILPVLGFANTAAVMSQTDFDAVEFCEQHIPLLARVNARYRATDWASLGPNPSVQALENTLLAKHEVVCDVTHKTPPVGGHVLLLVGFNRRRKAFYVKNSWGENRFIEIKYENDPEWQITSGYYLKDVVDPKFVQNEACWLGNWWVNLGNSTFRMLLRRSEDFAAPGKPTKFGTAYLNDGGHDVNGQFLNGAGQIRLFVAPTTAAVMPGTLTGRQIDAKLDFADIYNVSGVSGRTPVTMSRFATRFAAIFEKGDGPAWEARHGIDANTYQATFDTLLRQGFRLTYVNGYSEGRGARFNAIWQKKGGPAWQARHGLTAQQYQATFDSLLQQGFRPVIVSGYSENGQARYAAIWEQSTGPAWQARHGMSRAQYQQTFDEMLRQGFILTHVSAYRVNVDVQFAAIFERQDGVTMQARHALTSSAYQRAFDEMVAAGMKLTCVCGYSDTGIARYAAIWRKQPSGPWQARHGLTSARYQHEFDHLLAQGFMPVQVSGYGDGFYAA